MMSHCEKLYSESDKISQKTYQESDMDQIKSQ